MPSQKTTKAVREATTTSERVLLTAAIAKLQEEGLSGFQIEELVEELVEKALGELWEENKNA